jgi:CHAD domain-containing protein
MINAMKTSLPAPSRQAPLPDYAHAHCTRLIDRLAHEAARVRRSGDDEAIHDLRVTIRRLTQCVRVFGDFFPKGAVRRMRKQLKSAMTQSGEVRDRDIARDLAAQCGIEDGSLLREMLMAERALELARLKIIIERWHDKHLIAEWRASLGLDTQAAPDAAIEPDTHGETSETQATETVETAQAAVES